MKLAAMTQVTVDGVMPGNGPMDADGGNGFERGRLFPGSGPDIALGLADSQAGSKGVTIQVYRRPGARSRQPAEARDTAAPEPHPYH